MLYTTCDHTFHLKCLRKWYYTPTCECEQSKGCPVCRKPIFQKPIGLNQERKTHLDIIGADKFTLQTCVDDGGIIAEMENDGSEYESDCESDCEKESRSDCDSDCGDDIQCETLICAGCGIDDGVSPDPQDPSTNYCGVCQAIVDEASNSDHDEDVDQLCHVRLPEDSFHLWSLFQLPEEEPLCPMCGESDPLLYSHDIGAEVCVDCIFNYTNQDADRLMEEDFTEDYTPETPHGFYLRTRRLCRYTGVNMSYDDRLELPTNILSEWIWEVYHKCIHPRLSTTPSCVTQAKLFTKTTSLNPFTLPTSIC
jgi:hypothetical protein